MPKHLPIKERFEKAEQLVTYCLREFPETRGDDRGLWLKVAELQGFRLPKELIPFFYKIINFETVRRTRQKIQAEGLYLPEPQKVAERSLFCMEERQFFRKDKRRGERTTHQPQGFGNSALANSTNPDA